MNGLDSLKKPIVVFQKESNGFLHQAEMTSMNFVFG